MKRFLSVILCFIVIAGVVGVGVTFVNNNKPQETNVPERIVTLDGESATLTDKQLKSLESGADISFGSEMYRLSKVGDEKIYEHTDGENIFVTKYIGVNAAEKTYRTWEKVNDDVVTKAFMNSSLSRYVTNGGISEILKGYTTSSALTETLKKYVSDEQLTEILAEYEKGADLTETLKKYVTDEQMTSILADYVKGTDLRETLKGYVSDEELTNILAEYKKGSDLTETLKQYITSAKVSSMLNDYAKKSDLTAFLKKSETKPIIKYRMLEPGVSLTIQPYTMYFVQCYDSTNNLADLKLVGGSKDGQKGKFAFVIKAQESNCLTILQTGSVVLSDLVKTASSTKSISPSSNTCRLSYYCVSGNAA